MGATQHVSVRRPVSGRAPTILRQQRFDSSTRATESRKNVAEKKVQAVHAWEVEKVELHVAYSNGGKRGDLLSDLVRITADDMHLATMAQKPTSNQHCWIV